MNLVKSVKNGDGNVLSSSSAMTYAVKFAELSMRFIQEVAIKSFAWQFSHYCS